MRKLLIRRLAPLLAVLAIGVSACGSVEPHAATVNSTDITTQSLTNELKIVKGNSAYRSALEQAYSAKVAGTGKGTFNTTFTAQVLSLRIYYDLIEQGLDKQGVKVTAADDKKAATTIKGQLDQLKKGLFASFPADYRTQLAHQEAVVEKASTVSATGKMADDYFAKHKSQFETACVSHILITTDKRSDAAAKQEIDQIKAQLDAGADFATLAKAKSEDTGSKDAGGDLGCQPAGQYVAEFEKAVFSQPVGKVGDPVKTQFGYHLILVKSRPAATLDNVRQQVGQAAFNAFLLDLTCGKASKISVDPRYGTWDKGACSGGQGLAKVSPPKGPAKSTSTTTAK
jgi:hypothetical protein